MITTTEEFLKFTRRYKMSEKTEKQTVGCANSENVGFRFDFAEPEASIQSIVDQAGALIGEMDVLGNKIAEAEIDLKAQEGAKSIEVRQTQVNGKSPTEGHVTAMIDSDQNITTLRKRVAKLNSKMRVLREKLESNRDMRKLFVAWLTLQKSANLDA